MKGNLLPLVCRNCERSRLTVSCGEKKVTYRGINAATPRDRSCSPLPFPSVLCAFPLFRLGPIPVTTLGRSFLLLMKGKHRVNGQDQDQNRESRRIELDGPDHAVLSHVSLVVRISSQDDSVICIICRIKDEIQ